MKLQQIGNAAVLGVSLLLGSAAFAAEKKPIKIYEPINVGGKTLATGDYDLQWDGSGSNVELTFLKGKKVVATAPARMVETEKPAIGSGITTSASDNGDRTLSEIHFRGKKLSLELGGAQSAEVK
jgi:hypothetical protein